MEAWFDSHCHLQNCEEPPAIIVERARDAGVRWMLCAATDVDTSRIVAALDLEGVYAAVGVHPNDATGWDASARAAIEELLGSDSVVAVGESGLDFYRDEAPAETQRDAFEAHIDMALEHDRALVIHTRESLTETIEILEARSRLPRLVFHCWSGAASMLDRALATGGYISFAGNVSYKNAAPLREVAAVVPAEKLLVETDSPYLAPMPHRGHPNEPAFVVDVGAAVAGARGEDVSAIAAQTAENAKRLFAISLHSDRLDDRDGFDT